MKVEEKTFRFFEVSFYILAISVLFLVAIVLYFVGEKPKMCVDVIPESKYDVNGDEEVTITDIVIKLKELREIEEYYFNQDTREE